MQSRRALMSDVFRYWLLVVRRLEQMMRNGEADPGVWHYACSMLCLTVLRIEAVSVVNGI